jgi:hypothetical protein
MTLFACPSPKGSNHAGLYLNEAGQLVDRHGALWGASGSMALDQMPDDLHEKADAREEAEKRIQEVRSAIQKYCEEADLDERVCADIYKILEQVIPLRDKFAYGPNAKGEFKDGKSGLGRSVDRPGGAGATDENGHGEEDLLMHDEEDLLMDPQRFSNLATHLLGQGLAADDVEEALKRAGCPEEDCESIVSDCAEAYGKAVDRLPVSALHGGMGGYGHGSKHGEHEMASDSFTEMFGGAERLNEYTRDNFGFGGADSSARQEIALELRRWPRRKLAYDARGTRDDNSFHEMFPGAKRLLPTSM